MKMSCSFVPTLTEAKFEITPGRWVGAKNPCFIIAEIGQNHQGDIETAKRLIQAAYDAGVDCVKFQKSNLKSRFTKEVLKRPYLSQNSWGKTYGEHRRHLNFTDKDFSKLHQYANNLGLCFAASGMDKPSIDFLDEIKVPFFKIGSADCTNLPLLRHASKYKKPLVISTGMAAKEDVCKVYSDVIKVNKSIAILQCTSCYPTPPSNVNLNVIKDYQKLFPQAVIGYSGHEVGIGISLAAVTLGAKILERHITLNHSLKGSDHAASLEPSEIRHLVCEVKRIEEAMGSSTKQVQECEVSCHEKLGKTIVTTKHLKSGTILEEDMIEVKVASNKGYDPINFYDLIGKELKQDMSEEQTIMPDDLI
ncbi:sialic acid synthase [Parasteatoda tepidariorum]|uniref:sialic acid synthase n=1 Tax=Parasteatoda tepidariorum TaxID=114398 RepID=UPI00077FB1B5|nr:sialic acid synthase [Parasteatoda tepidariorum]